MTSTTSSATAHVDDDFLFRQRGELNARRRSCRELIERRGRRPTPVARLEAVPEATKCVTCPGGSIARRS